MTGRPIIRGPALGALLLLCALALPDVALANAQADDLAPNSWEYWIRQNAVLAALIAGSVALIGHLIPLWRDMIARTLSAKIETAIECRFFPPQHGQRPIELRFLVTNKGGRRSRLDEVDFWVKGIEGAEQLRPFERTPPLPDVDLLMQLLSWSKRIFHIERRSGGQEQEAGVRAEPEKQAKRAGSDVRKTDKLHFPTQYVTGKIVPSDDEWLFVDAGTTQAFTFPAMIPASLSLILVRLTLRPKASHWYTDERVFQRPPPETPLKGK